VTEATNEEFAEIMLTNTCGPIRLAHHLLGRLVMPGGTLAFMSSHRGSIAINVEGGPELYRASKVALNMLARGIYSDNKDGGLTVLSIHPGWARTAMGTLDGAVEPAAWRMSSRSTWGRGRACTSTTRVTISIGKAAVGSNWKLAVSHCWPQAGQSIKARRRPNQEKISL
jgi:NAD(P)-dependent dehydrogenase (short-subunit alcohol dehydrogenase family)